MKKGPYVEVKAENLQQLYIQNTNAPLCKVVDFPFLETLDSSANSFENIHSEMFQEISDSCMQ